jgi:hypothetical protein
MGLKRATEALMGGQLEMEHDVIYFDQSESKALRAEQVDKINNAAKFLKLLSDELTALIKGHASGEGNPTINQELSEQRASTVRDLLQGMGVSIVLTTVGVGSTQLAVAETAKDPKELERQRQQNRRVEIIITSNPLLSQQPQPPNLWQPLDHIPDPGAPFDSRRLRLPRRFRKPPQLRTKEMTEYKKDLDDWFKAHHILPDGIYSGVLGKFKNYEDAPPKGSPPSGGGDDDQQ